MADSNFPSELFLPFLNEDKSLPQYVALFRAFQQAIVQGKLIPGAKLPATRPLGLSLGISRNTVKSAYEMLLAEGYIDTEHGSGSFVSKRLPDQASTSGTQTKQQAVTVNPTEVSILAKRLEDAYHSPNASLESNLLSHGKGCLESFPWRQWQRHVTHASRQMKYAQGDSVMGNTRLRAQIANYLQVARGVHCDTEQIIVCSGSQQAMYLSFQILLNPGDPVLVEDPGYQGIDGAIDTLGGIKIPVETDQQGFRLDTGLAKAPHARVATLTPTRNYPMGYTLSLARRLAILDWAKQTGSWIIEDDYDSEFRFDGPPITSLQGLGGESCVIYAGTFSRILHPSIRLGYLVVPEALLKPFYQLKRFIDGGLSQLPQLALAEFMAAGDFTSHVRRARKLYQQRREILRVEIERQCGDILKRVESDGGMHSVFLFADQTVSDKEVCLKANAIGIGVLPLSAYYSGDKKQHGLIIGFAAHDESAIKRGVSIIAECIRP
ncbi:PLP-dependent aminotransferase family protein [Leucothrix pacifica]|uniref:HTH gntR-type domain-containing protein n=1 Tax=Leucothrix pacifica TaxID=1247513 RepID=A0A317CPX6_9GAMM|nr:PLP-dependent aminotransferase family protein [Leucothrix pacifica]PWR00400.1 hypothetical protein DKW60_02280 [Leucothrix pacifica]